MSCCPNEHRCGCNDPIDGPICDRCGRPATEADLRTFPDPHYVCRTCDQIEAEEHRLWAKANTTYEPVGMTYQEWLADTVRRWRMR